MFKKNNHNFLIIKNNKELDQFIAKIKNKKKIFFDTEFERRSTYKAIISIIVIFDGTNIGIIDCLQKNLNFKKIFKFINKKKTNNYETNRSIIRNRSISLLWKRNINNWS